jgi:hypothetical protein
MCRIASGRSHVARPRAACVSSRRKHRRGTHGHGDPRHRRRAGRARGGCRADRRGRRPIVIEGGARRRVWRAHYERLHLHTVKELSALPGMPFPAVDRATCRASASSTTSTPTPRAPGSRRASASRRRRSSRSKAGGGRRPAAAMRFARASSLSAPAPTASRSYRRSKARPSSRARSCTAAAIARRAVHGPAGPGRRHGQHRRRDRARPGRAGVPVALGAVAGQRRLPRRPRPADAKTTLLLWRLPTALGDALARWLCDVTVATSVATACVARRSRRCASCASTVIRR